MTTIITRLYSSSEQADAAVDTLADKKFSRGAVNIVSGISDANAAKKQISALGVYPNAAATYADKVAGGNALLVVNVGFGMAYKAKSALADTGAIDGGVKHTEVHASEPESTGQGQTRHLPELLNMTVFTGESLPHSGETWLPFHSIFRFPLLSSKEGRASLITGKLFTQFMPMIIKYRES